MTTIQMPAELVNKPLPVPFTHALRIPIAKYAGAFTIDKTTSLADVVRAGDVLGINFRGVLVPWDVIPPIVDPIKEAVAEAIIKRRRGDNIRVRWP